MEEKSSFSEKRKGYILKLEKAYEEHAPHMKRTVCAMLKDEHIAEDAVHNVFEKLIKGESYIFDEGEAAAAYYLTASVRNEAIRLYNKQHKYGYLENIDDEHSLASSLNTEDIVISKEAVKKAAEFLKRENSAYAAMFILYYTNRKTIEELADANGMNAAAVRKGIYRLKVKVAEFLREER